MSKPVRQPQTPESIRLGAELVDLTWKKPPPEQQILELLERGADPDARDWMQRPALSLAIGSQNISLARLLLKHGANPDLADSFGSTALMWAVDASVPELIPALLEKGASINAIDRDGYTALMRAAIGGKGNLVRLLLDAGAALDMQSDYGSTALTLACLNVQRDIDNGHDAIARLLTDCGANTTLKNRDNKTGPDYLRERGHTALLAYIESAPARREAARPKLIVPKPEKKLKPLPGPKKPPCP